MTGMGNAASETRDALPSRIKLDPDTPLERMFWVIAGIGFGSAMVWVEATADGDPVSPWWLRVGLTLLAIGLLGRLGTDNYYVLDVEQRVLLYHFQLFFWIDERPFARQDQIAAIGTTGHLEDGDWTYDLVLLDNDSTLHWLTNEKRKEVTPVNRLGERLAAALGVRFVPGRSEYCARPGRDHENRLTIEQVYSPRRDPESTDPYATIGQAVALLVAAIVMGWVALSLPAAIPLPIAVLLWFVGLAACTWWLTARRRGQR